MKALTVKQPWAWAITAGKNVENRSRNTHYRGPVAIHAGLGWSDRGASFGPILDAWAGYAAAVEPPQVVGRLRKGSLFIECGAIIATAEIVDSHPAADCCEPWGDAEYDGKLVWHWVLDSVVELPRAVPCRGALGLWTVPDDVVSAISAGVAASPDGGE